MITRLTSSYGRRCISSFEVAKLLVRQHPQEDPRSLRETRVKAFSDSILQKQDKSITDLNITEIHQAWKEIYNAQLHDTAFDEMADPGEQCDGELPSWTRDRLSVEKDKDFNVPTVSAHEASVRLRQLKNK